MFERRVSIDAAGYGAKDSSTDGIGTRDGATGSRVLGFALKGTGKKRPA